MDDLSLIQRTRLREASLRVADAAFEQALDTLVDSWTDGFFNLLHGVHLSEQDVEHALHFSGLNADEINEKTNPEALRTAGLGDWVSALGGKILKSVWHSLIHPFLSAWKLITSSSYRTEFKKAVKRAVKHEIRSTKHMVMVAARIAQGEKVPPQEIKVAALQFADIASKVLIGVILGPHIAHLLIAGPLKILMTLLSPADEIAGIMLDKPMRWVTQKFLGEAIGLLPSGFYTHF